MSSFQSRSIFKNAYRSDIIRTIIVCGGFFVFLWFVETIFNLSESGTAIFFEYIKNPLLLPLDVEQFIYQPWSLLSFGFIENSFWSLLTNMVWLWIFGTVIEDLRGTNRVFPIFWIGSIVSGICLLAVSTFYDMGGALYYSTLGGVAAVAAATITFKPRYVFYALFNKGIPIYVFGIIFLGLSIFLRFHNVAAVVVFFTGAGLGYLSQNVLWDLFEWLRNAFGNIRTYFSSNQNFIKKDKRTTKKPSVDKHFHETRLNEILDKINVNGMESITKAERDYLSKYNH